MPSITALQAELGRPLFALVVLVVLGATLATVASLRRGGATRTAAVVARVALGVTVVGVLSLTLFGWLSPTEAEPILILDPVEGWWGWDSIAWRPVVDNVALFVPVGALTAAVWWRRSPALVWFGCLLLSVAIETFQFVVPTGRIATTGDLITNGLGAALGVILAVMLRVREGPRRRADDRDRQPA